MHEFGYEKHYPDLNSTTVTKLMQLPRVTLRVGSRGRLTIPPQALAALGWKPGDTLLMALDEQGHLTAQKKL